MSELQRRRNSLRLYCYSRARVARRNGLDRLATEWLELAALTCLGAA